MGAFQTQADVLDVRERFVAGGSAAAIRFRGFAVFPRERSVLRDGRPIDLGSRAFDLLMVLLRSRGEVVTKSQIVEHVWPSTIVDDSNLRFQMACLRRALGVDRDVIKTIQGRGYLIAVDGSDEPASYHDIGAPAASAPGPSQAVIPAGLGECSAILDGAPVVAVIEDDRDVRESIQGLLRSTGVATEGFASVDAFLDSGRHGRVDCLILDVWLPGRTGLEFQGDIVKANIDVPIIFISGHADIHMSVRAMKAGAAEFLTKPVRHEDLMAAVRCATSRDRPRSAPWSMADYRPSTAAVL